MEAAVSRGRPFIRGRVRARARRHLASEYGVSHDCYQRTSESWKFTERVYDVGYLDTTPLGGLGAARGGGERRPAGVGDRCGSESASRRRVAPHGGTKDGA